MKRLFAAIPIPAPASDRIAALLAEVRDQRWPVRWVSETGLHLTLKFYGEVPDERVEVIAEAVGFAVQGTGTLPLALEGVGAFPSLERARVVWVGVEPAPALELLQDRIERGAEPLGFAPEGVPFRPHVTLGRVREGERLPPAAVRRLAALELAEPFVADALVLYESRLDRRRPEYHAVRTYRLAS
jgi:2'-5' RNA ligase